MAKGGDTMSATIRRLVEGGGVVDLDAATTALFGSAVDQGQRNRAARVVAALVFQGDLRRVGRGRYRGAPVATPQLPPRQAEELPSDVEEPLPPPAHPSVERRLNRLALAVNAVHEELSGLRHDLRVAESLEGERPSLPMRCAEPWERDL